EALPRLVGPEVCLVPSRGGRPPRLLPPDAVLLVRVRDKPLLRATLAVLKALAGGWRWRSVAVGTETIHYDNRMLPGAPLAPAYVLRDDVLALAATPQALWRWLDGLDGPRLADAPAFRRAAARLGDAPSMGFVYLEAGDAAAAAYDAGVALLHAAVGPDRTAADPALLPPAADVVRRRPAAALGVAGDAEGFGLEATGPGGLAAPALWALGHAGRQAVRPEGLLTWALLRAPASSERAAADDPAGRQSTERLFAIHRACLAYREDHGAWPEALEALVDRGYLDAAAAVAPTSPAGRPYLLLPVGERVRAATPVAMEPLDAGRDGARILFGGGVVEYVPREEIPAVLRGGDAE
ncbi:MAG: hypothetical protein ACOCX4_04575, partial [Planctomycetota bacterium]